MSTIKALTIENFTAFRKAKFHFSPGINVLIGENNTGKTHVLKLVYALMRMASAKSYESDNVDEQRETRAVEKLLNVFKPVDMAYNRLTRKSNSETTDEDALRWRINLRHERFEMTLNWLNLSLPPDLMEHPETLLTFYTPRSSGPLLKQNPPAIFLPGREVLSIFPGFIPAYEYRESALDETYYDLCVALEANPLRREKYADVEHLVEPLEMILGGKNRVTKKNKHFYITLPDAGQIEAQLTAEGFRKLATLVYLIRNGSIAPGTVLLWDEPEANLNPKLVTAVVKFLTQLADAGVQIFIATHDFLFSYELSLRAEYDLHSNIKFFGLYRDEGKDGVQVQEGQTMADLAHEPILDAFVQYHEQADQLFYDRQTTSEAEPV